MGEEIRMTTSRVVVLLIDFEASSSLLLHGCGYIVTDCVPSGLSPVSPTPLTRYHSALVLSQEGKHGVHLHDRILTSLERPANDKMSGMQKRQYHMQPKRDIHASGPLNPSYDP